MRARAWWGLFFGLVTVAAHGSVTAGPTIVGDANDARCRDALEMASAAFQSKNPSLLWPIHEPSRPATKVVLRQSLKDISGGHALEADTAEFALFRPTTGEAVHPTIWWGRRISAGKRLAVIDEPFGWRGDIYSVFLLDAGATPERFTQQVETQIAGGHFLEGVLGEVQWIPPIILFEGRSQSFWIIDREALAMADWKVHGVIAKGLTTPCRISFGLSKGEVHDPMKGALDRMPTVVRKLAVALDEALGPGTDEGTLQPTARIRGTVAEGWANAALRPWALTDTPYNKRSEVELGLAEWAKGNRRRTALLRRIHITYPSAERALALYYSGRFKAAPPLARHALDYMFRTYFVFHTDTPPDPDELVR